MWDEGKIALLTQLWLVGLTTTEIGERTGLSKNAVCGKAHRLGLPPRQSPIKRGCEPREPLTQRANSIARRPPKVTLPAGHVPAMPLRAVVAARRSGPRCCWPTNDGKPMWLFCTGMAIQERPYCAAHCAIAYVPVRERRKDGM